MMDTERRFSKHMLGQETAIPTGAIFRRSTWAKALTSPLVLNLRRKDRPCKEIPALQVVLPADDK